MSNPKSTTPARKRYYKEHHNEFLAYFRSYHEINRELANAAARQRRSEIAEINPCYFKEAKAILEGRNWRGKNRCKKLPGDPE